METYFEVANSVKNMTNEQRTRYVLYMRMRWADSEFINCKSGYAVEWAERFAHNSEYGASDSVGQMVLATIDAKYSKKESK